MMIHRPQEIPLDDPRSNNMFKPTGTKPFVATPAALEMFGSQAILGCLEILQLKAKRHGGLDYLQVFEDPEKAKRLWFIEDGEGGTITALLPSDH